jgi:formamidase
MHAVMFLFIDLLRCHGFCTIAVLTISAKLLPSNVNPAIFHESIRGSVYTSNGVVGRAICRIVAEGNAPDTDPVPRHFVHYSSGVSTMAETIIKIDLNKTPYENEMIHNRWHPDIPMVKTVKPGEDFIIECYDWTGGQIKNDDCADDVRDVDLSQVHFLSGPVGVEGAEPGDLLVVDILDIGAFQESLWGFNGFFSKQNGGGFLTEHFPEAQKSIWDINGMFTKSRHIPNVEFAGLMHPGLIGCLPSKEMLLEWNKREKELYDTEPDRVPALATLPYADTAHMGKMAPDAAKVAAAEGARTVPPREHGGNCDIKDLSRGSKIYFPVYVKGGGLSVGDLHFSQGDGEITFCGAIEMAGWIHLRVNLIKDGMAKYAIKNPIFKPSPIAPKYDDYLIFEGISVDEYGQQHYLDVHVAYRQACLNAINYLTKFGYSKAQAYSILGCAPVQGHISGVVDIPNACATLWLPTDIFDFDVNPSAEGPSKKVSPGMDVPLSKDK